MKISEKLAVISVALMSLAVVLELIDQVQTGNGFHFRSLHAATLLLVLAALVSRKKPS
jgi:hypothetical protein